MLTNTRNSAFPRALYSNGVYFVKVKILLTHSCDIHSGPCRPGQFKFKPIMATGGYVIHGLLFKWHKLKNCGQPLYIAIGS